MDVKRFIGKRFPLMLGMLLLISSSFSVSADEHFSREDQLKSAFLYRIAKFVKWPHQDRRDKTFNFCVADNIEFTHVLEDGVSNKTITNKTISVRYVSLKGVVDSCHVLYTHDLESTKLNQFLLKIKHKPILSVGSSSDFIEQGGIIRFIEDSNRLSFEINNSLALSLDLEINAHLLRLSNVR